MRKLASPGALFVLLLAGSTLHAALPPYYQRMKDLKAIVAFAESHKEIMAGLMTVDMKSNTLHYQYKGKSCVASFKRAKKDEMTKPMVGPAPPLVFDRSTCPLANSMD